MLGRDSYATRREYHTNFGVTDSSETRVQTKYIPAGGAAGARGAADHLWGGHWRAVILVGRLASVIGHGDAIVTSLDQEAFRPDLIGKQRPTRHHQVQGDGKSTNRALMSRSTPFHADIL